MAKKKATKRSKLPQAFTVGELRFKVEVTHSNTAAGYKYKHWHCNIVFGSLSGWWAVIQYEIPGGYGMLEVGNYGSTPKEAAQLAFKRLQVAHAAAAEACGYELED